MIKRTLYFGNQAYLNLQKDQLVIDPKDENKPKRSVPVEDIGLLVIDHHQVTVTHGLINALIDNNAAILWCDCRHMPNGLVLPMSSNHVFTEKLQYQLSASEPLKKQLWKQTVQAKLFNQAAVLKTLGFDDQKLLYWRSQTGSGDPKNMEGRAAACYWKCLFEAID